MTPNNSPLTDLRAQPDRLPVGPLLLLLLLAVRPALAVQDCNANGVDDAADIAGGTSKDCNGNRFPDECEPFSLFEETTTYGATDFLGGYWVVDVSGDGAPDVVALEGPNILDPRVQIFKNRGDSTGVLESQPSVYPLRYIAWGPNWVPGGTYAPGLPLDLDSNGTIDLAITGGFNGTGNLSILLNDGAGKFAVREYPLTFDPVNDAPGALMPGDLDDDGDIDLLITTGISVTRFHYWLALNDGRGGFEIRDAVRRDYRVFDIFLEDLNRDGLPDLVMNEIASQSPNVHVLRNTGSATFEGTDIPRGLGPLAVADMDNDGDPDLVLLDVRVRDWPIVRVKLNDGLGAFSPGFEHLVTLDRGTQSAGFELEDLNGDAYPDVIITNVSQLLVLWNRNGTGLVQAQLLDRGYVLASLADLDGDGLVDLIAVKYSQSGVEGVHVFRNDVVTPFLPATAVQQSASFGSQDPFLVMDLDADGDLDLLRYGGGALSGSLSVGRFAFADSVDSVFAGDLMSSADMDGDRRPDMVARVLGGIVVALNRQQREGGDCNANEELDSCEVEAGTAHDCNHNGVPDTCDLLDGTATDGDQNGIPDGCPVPFRRGDVNVDGSVDLADVAMMRAFWEGILGSSCPAAADFEGDDRIDLSDGWLYLGWLVRGSPPSPAPPGADEPGLDPTPGPTYPCTWYRPTPPPHLADLDFDFSGPATEITGMPGEVRTIEVLCTITTAGYQGTLGLGPVGWSLSVSAEGGRIESVSEVGMPTSGLELLAWGEPPQPVELQVPIHVAEPAIHPVDGRSGVVSAVYWLQPGLIEPPYGLPTVGTTPVARLSVQVEIPPAGESFPLILRYQDGLKTPEGRPIKNLAALELGEAAQTPTVHELQITVRATVGGAQLPADANQDGALDLSDAIWLLGHLFLGTAERLPCEGGAAGDPGAGELKLIDFNGDASIDLSDAIAMLGFLFLGSTPPVLGEQCVRIAGCPDVPAACEQ